MTPDGYRIELGYICFGLVETRERAEELVRWITEAQRRTPTIVPLYRSPNDPLDEAEREIGRLNADLEDVEPRDLVAEVSAANDRARKAEAQIQPSVDAMHAWRERCERAEREVERLRGILHQVVDRWENGSEAEFYRSIVAAREAVKV